MIEGKSIMNWHIPAVLKGDANAVGQALVDAGFESIMLKGGDGFDIFKISRFSPWPTWGQNIREDFVNTLREVFGLKIIIWHFVYGTDSRTELKVAHELCTRFKPDGYVWNAESAFDSKPNAEANARLISQGLKDLHPSTPQGLCWWALPKNPDTMTEWHPVRVAKAFMESVDCVLPMMYWGGKTTTDALSYLQRSLKVWESFSNLPMIPIGRAYTGDGGIIDPSAILAFGEKVMKLREEKNFVGLSWWSLDKVFGNSDCWNVLKILPKFKTPILETGKLSMEEILTRLVYEHKHLYPEFF